MPETDKSLLQSFAATRDGAAFRLLAERYLGLIFHTALRRTGNRQLAQEVSQSVLCALAHKAGSLAGHPERLPAWLHRAAVFESTKTMRSESAHQRRKRLLHPDQIDTTGESAAPWSDAIPHLDAALDKLLAQSKTSKFQSLSNHSHNLSSTGHLTHYLLSALVSADHPGAAAILSEKSERDRHSLKRGDTRSGMGVVSGVAGSLGGQ